MADSEKRKRSELQDIQAVLTRIVAKETQGNTLPMLRADENKVAQLRSPAHGPIVGPQGSGKTTLIYKFREECKGNPSRNDAAILVDCQRENFATDTPRKAVVRTIASVLEAVARELEPRRGFIFGRGASELVVRARGLREKLLPLLKRSDVREETITEDVDEFSAEHAGEQEGSGKERVVKANKNESKFHVGAEGKWTGTIKAGAEYSRTQHDLGHSSKWSYYHKSKASEKRSAYRRVVQYSEKNDIMHDLEALDDQIKALVHDALVELGVATLHLCLDNFGRIPLTGQPWVADYLRRLDPSVSVKLAGEISQIDPYTAGESGSFGLQEGMNLTRIDVSPQREMAQGLEFFRNLLGEIDALHSGEPLQKLFDDDSLRALMIYSGCRPGLFIRLLASVAEEATDRSKRKGGLPKIDRAMIQAAAVKSFGLRRHANLSLADELRELVETDLGEFAVTFKKRDVALRFVDKGFLALNPEQRMRYDLLVDLGILHLVSRNVERQGHHFEVFYVDLAALQSMEGVERERVAGAIPKLLGIAEMMSPSVDLSILVEKESPPERKPDEGK